MQLSLYHKEFDKFFTSATIQDQVRAAVQILKDRPRVFFIGNGGSNAISSHMMEDFAKIYGSQTFSFTDAALITCFANDYGYENAVAEWLKIQFKAGDVLVAISSSGKSENIVNAARYASSIGNVITLTGFKENNELSTIGELNFHLSAENYGIVECFHQVILHVILDTLHAEKNK